MMQIQYTKNLKPGRFDLGTTLSAEIVKIEALNVRGLGRNQPAESLSLPLFLPPPSFPDHARPFFSSTL